MDIDQIRELLRKSEVESKPAPDARTPLPEGVVTAWHLESASGGIVISVWRDKTTSRELYNVKTARAAGWPTSSSLSTVAEPEADAQKRAKTIVEQRIAAGFTLVSVQERETKCKCEHPHASHNGENTSCRAASCPCVRYAPAFIDIEAIKALVRAKPAPEGDIVMKDGTVITDQWRLKFQKGASDKVYFVTVFDHILNKGASFLARYSVDTEWGRRGAKRQQQIVVWTDELDHARREANKIVDAKMEKGYVFMDDSPHT